MKNCPVCGAQLQDTDMVCSVCGAQQVVNQGAYDQAQQYQQGAYDQAQQFQQGAVDPAMQYQQGGYDQFQQGAYDQGQQFQQNMGGMDQVPYGVDPYTQPQGMVPQPAAPKSGNGKKIAIIAGCVAAVALIGFAVWFFFLRGGGAGSAKAVAEKGVKALLDGDADEVYECFPDGMLSKEEKEQLKEVLQYMGMMGSMVKSVKAGSETKLSGSDADYYINKMKDNFDIDVKAVSTVPVTIEIEFMGQSDKQTMDVVCGKVGSSWYIIDGLE